jgi:hypothetical protein
VSAIAPPAAQSAPARPAPTAAASKADAGSVAATPDSK